MIKLIPDPQCYPRVRELNLPAFEIEFTTIMHTGPFTFNVLDADGVVQISTYHATLADALRQVANSLDNYRLSHIHYVVER